MNRHSSVSFPGQRRSYIYLLSYLFLSGTLAVSPALAQPAAQTADEKIAALEKRVEQLERLLKVVEETKQEVSVAAPVAAPAQAAVAAAAPQPATGPVVTTAAPFSLGFGDGNFLFKVGGDLQVDHRTFYGPGAAGVSDQILLRRARPTFSGTAYKYVDFYLRPDFGLGTTTIYDAYMQFNYFSQAVLRVGKFKPPVGLERLQSDDDTSFVERGLPTLLVPSRDIGYQLSGDFFKKRVNYAIGVFNGVPDNSLSDASPTSHRDLAGRIFLTPVNTDKSTLGFGLGATGGSVDGLALPAYKSFGQNTFFTFASGVTSAGHRTRLAPQGYYYLGPAGLYAEYTVAEEGFQKGSVRRDIALRSWQTEASYILTGEKKVFGNLAPKKMFDPRAHTWGAWELALRVGDFSTEAGMFNYGFASVTTSPRHAHEIVGAVNWYLNRMVRISLDYGNTNYGGGGTAAQGGNRPSEQVLLNRFQISF